MGGGGNPEFSEAFLKKCLQYAQLKVQLFKSEHFVYEEDHTKWKLNNVNHDNVQINPSNHNN